jgi:GNAT superfamily N-acetyltransferase
MAKPSPKDEEEVFNLAESLATSYKLNRNDFSKVYAALLKNAFTDVIVAKIESRLVGYVLAFHHPTFYANGLVSWVEELFVLEEFRGKNIGKRLMEIIEEKCIQRDSKLVALATRRASGFYKAIGYEESAAYFKKTL